MSAESQPNGTLEAVVTRCGCGDPARIHPGAPCPTPRAIEDRGVIARFNVPRSMAGKIKRRIQNLLRR